MRITTTLMTWSLAAVPAALPAAEWDSASCRPPKPSSIHASGVNVTDTGTPRGRPEGHPRRGGVDPR